MTEGYKVNKKAFQRKCPNCGASLKYNPTNGKLFCEHCKSEIDFEKSRDVQERDFEEMFKVNKWDEDKVACYRCKNCGASSVLTRTTLATTCPYCSSPVVVDETETGLVRPDSLVPFELSEEQAAIQLSNWKRRKYFAPNFFRHNSKAHSITGLYTPAWTFDLDTVTYYRGRLGKTETRTVRRNGKTYTESYIRWFNVQGDIDIFFDDIFVSGNNHISVKNFNELNLTNHSKYVVYSDEYLAGYIADNYSIGPEEAYNTAIKKANSKIYSAIMARYGADHDGGLTLDLKVMSRSFKYMLLPVYIATSIYRNKAYNQFISGVYADKSNQKVKVCGNAPVSAWKVLLTVLAGLGALVGIVALVLINISKAGGFLF